MSTLAIQQKTVCDHSFIVEGQVTSATTNSLTDTKKNWPINILRGRRLTIWYGKGLGQVVSVQSNTHNQLFIDGNWITIPDSASNYRVRINSVKEYCPKCNGSSEYRDHSFSSGKRKTLTGIFQFAQSVDSMMLLPRGASIFNSDIGSGIELVINSDILDDDEIQMFVENNVVSSMNFLSSKQREAIPYLNFDDSELFGQLKSIDVKRKDGDQITMLELNVEVIASSQEEVLVTAPLITR